MNNFNSLQDEDENINKTLVNYIEEGTLVPSRGEAMDCGTLVPSGVDLGTMLINSDTEEESTMKSELGFDFEKEIYKLSINT